MTFGRTVLLASVTSACVLATGVPAPAHPSDGARSARATVYRQVVGAPLTVATNHSNGAEVPCPEGMFATGGGFTTDGSADRVFQTSSFSTGRGWYVDFRNVSGAPRTVRPTVVCSTAQHRNQNGDREAVAPMRAATVFSPRCPEGSTPSGGGFSGSRVFSWLSAPQHDGSWGVQAVNTRYLDGSLAVTVTCSAEPHQELSGDEVVILPGETKDAVIKCPAGQTPTGGGGFVARALLHTIFLSRSFARGDTWVVTGTNTGSDENGLTASAVCAKL
ncbi:hypothetical protein ACIGFK_04860 [Streptomyces sp. NPDC085524]|uniref:hypothetical protein n=1 Tax=unclassified Streptomyces TaxID=2593676 RepID=UPI003681FB60